MRRSTEGWFHQSLAKEKKKDEKFKCSIYFMISKTKKAYMQAVKGCSLGQAAGLLRNVYTRNYKIMFDFILCFQVISQLITLNTICIYKSMFALIFFFIYCLMDLITWLLNRWQRHVFTSKNGKKLQWFLDIISTFHSPNFRMKRCEGEHAYQRRLFKSLLDFVMGSATGSISLFI